MVWDREAATQLRCRHRILASPVGVMPASNAASTSNFPAVLMPEQALLAASEGWVAVYRGPPGTKPAQRVSATQLEEEIEVERTAQARAQRSVFNDLWARGYYVTSGALYGAHLVAYARDPQLCHSFAAVLACAAGDALSPRLLAAFVRMQGVVGKAAVLATAAADGAHVSYATLAFECHAVLATTTADGARVSYAALAFDGVGQRNVNAADATALWAAPRKQNGFRARGRWPRLLHLLVPASGSSGEEGAGDERGQAHRRACTTSGIQVMRKRGRAALLAEKGFHYDASSSSSSSTSSSTDGSGDSSSSDGNGNSISSDSSSTDESGDGSSSSSGRSGVYDPRGCSEKQIAALRWNSALLAATASRRPHLLCFGLHEWAMLYDVGDGGALPLRVSQRELNAAAGARGALQCTHFDAYRFFAKGAAPLNAHAPTRAAQPALEQPGCVHAAMDLLKAAALWLEQPGCVHAAMGLLKARAAEGVAARVSERPRSLSRVLPQWAMKAAPYVPSEIVVDALEVALAARQLDMRASPYDLTAFDGDLGCDPAPIRVETAEGRRQYQELQLQLYHKSAPVRGALIRAYDALLSAHARAVAAEP
ncbi:hypothetical protein JKP88DRAFT_312074 [Tribonema minus]|uniref:tRNA-intron lyase n=1 Tax=Tribonema minus TaxID=303371 RepID=A0A835Z5M8_9STRA|nr:hypothetical protein JKP88DRAFT_312074 [Tribonema minus]